MIPFLQLRPGGDAADVRAQIDRSVGRGWVVLGLELDAFEAEYNSTSGNAYGIGVGTGPDAMAIGLRCLTIGPGGELMTPPLSAPDSAPTYEGRPMGGFGGAASDSFYLARPGCTR